MAPVTILERGRRIAGLVLAALAVVLLLMVMGGAQAQTPKDKAAKPEGAIAEPATREAIRVFQKEHGLVTDGIAGPKTLAALGVAAESDPIVTSGILNV